MSTREQIQQFMEKHPGVGYTVYELMDECQTSESRTRKHLIDLVNEKIIKSVRTPGDAMHYGFVGVACNVEHLCKDVVDECRMFAHRCEKRETILNDQ